MSRKKNYFTCHYNPSQMRYFIIVPTVFWSLFIIYVLTLLYKRRSWLEIREVLQVGLLFLICWLGVYSLIFFIA